MKISNKEDEQCKIYKLNRTLEKCSISKKKNGEIAISGRELHQALEVKTAYKDWFPRMLKYGFEENTDYTAIAQKEQQLKAT